MSSVRKFVIVIALFLVVCFAYTLNNQTLKGKEQLIHSEAVMLKEGYGYQILKGEKILILQKFIPGLPGKQTFKTKKQAISVANLAIDKIERGESPILRSSDLSKLNISITGNY